MTLPPYPLGEFFEVSRKYPEFAMELSTLSGCRFELEVTVCPRNGINHQKPREILDRHQVAFVSVTQQFSTANSMGRLVLNVLLSFAQFEREIISERTRDKIAAARCKGKWMGGMPLLGYDISPEGSKLVVNPAEANRVQAIFELYLEHQSLMAVIRILDARKWLNKRWTTKKGTERGGKQFTKVSLHKILTNVVYCGKLTMISSIPAPISKLNPTRSNRLNSTRRNILPRNCC